MAAKKAKQAKKAKKPQELTMAAVDRLRIAVVRAWVKAGKVPTSPPGPTLDDAGGSYARLIELITAQLRAEESDPHYQWRKRIGSEVAGCSWRDLRDELRKASEGLRRLLRPPLDAGPLLAVERAMLRAPDHPLDADDLQAVDRAADLTGVVLDAIPAPIGRKPLTDLHVALWKELRRSGGDHGCLKRDIDMGVHGVRGTRLKNRLNELRAEGYAELLPGGKRWRAIGKEPTC